MSGEKSIPEILGKIPRMGLIKGSLTRTNISTSGPCANGLIQLKIVKAITA
jgi:hypothetical protein